MSARIDLSAAAAGRPLRIVLLAFYDYHPLLAQRGHEVNHQVPVCPRFEPDLVGMSVGSPYLAGRPNLVHRFWADTNQREMPAGALLQPNFDNSPFSQAV